MSSSQNLSLGLLGLCYLTTGPEGAEAVALLRAASLASLVDTGLSLSEASASKSCIRRFVITEKAPTRAFFWLKAATTAFTFKTLLPPYCRWVDISTWTPPSQNWLYLRHSS